MGHKNESFVMITKEELTSPGYKGLSTSAKMIFVVAKFEAGRQIRAKKEKRIYGDYNGLYNADFILPYTLIERYTTLSEPTIASSLRELIQTGFILKTLSGGLIGAGGVASRYRLSLAWQKSSPIIKQKRTIRLKKVLSLSRFSQDTQEVEE